MKQAIFAWVGDRLSFPRVLPMALGAALLVSLSVLPVGFLVDDYVQLAALDGFDAPNKPYELYTFADGVPANMARFVDNGPWPWWALPELKLRFFRPLSSALCVLEHAITGASALATRVHTIAWYLLFVAAAGLLFRRAMPTTAGAIAVMLFAIDDAHVLPVAWTANRHAIVSGALALFAIAGHVGWRTTRRKALLAWAIAAGVAALLAGETALAIFGYVFAFELVGNTEARGARIRALVPWVILGVAYVLVYRGLGYGAYGSAVYLDPGTDPLGFLAAAVVRVPVLIGAVILGTPADVWMPVPALRLPLVAAGVVSVALVVWLLRRAGEAISAADRRAAGWLMLGGLLALVPCAATFPAARLTLMAGPGAFAVVAVVLDAAWMAAAAGAGSRWISRSIVTLHVVLPVLAWPGTAALLVTVGAAMRTSNAGMELDPAQLAGQRVVVLQTSNPLSALYPPVEWLVTGRPVPKSWWPLSFTPDPVTVRRTSETTLELSLDEGTRFFQTTFEQLVRDANHPFEKGFSMRMNGLVATVVDVDARGPSRLRFAFDRPLEDPGLVFLSYRQGTMRRVTLPPVGGEIRLVVDGPILGR